MRLVDLFEDSPRDRFERTPAATGKLVIFDIDDTLVNTTTKVGVKRDGKLIKQLNSHDFTHYELQPGEEFDFGGFRDAREFYTQARPIPGMMKQLKRDIESGNKVIMLTARSDFNDRDVFLDTFRQYGIDMDRIHVYRAGNLVTKAATEEKKKIILKHLLGKHAYEKVIMYDDSVPNLNAFLSLKQDFPYTEFYAWHVDPSGRADEYHRTGLNEESGQGHPAWRIRFRRFSNLPAVIPEREGKVYLMPTDENALKTFYSLTGKDFTKINNMPTEAYMVSGDAMVGDMHTINYLLNAIKELKHWRSAWTPESVEKREKYIEELKQEYLDKMEPLSQYQPGQFSMPEILAEPGQIQPVSRSVIYDKNTGDIVLRPKSGTGAELDEGLRDTLAGLALGAGVAMSGGAEAKTEKMVVSPGQTVYSIAQAFDTTPQAIQRANRLDRKMTIRPGQTLVIPQPGVKSVAQPAVKPAVKPAAKAAAKPVAKQSQPAKLQTLTGTTAEAIAKRLALQQGLKGLELAAFLAQIKHESWDFKRMHEVGDKRYFQRMYDKKYKPAKAKGLGNTEPGDGVRYRGRGYMQLTGRDNYRRVGRLLGVDLENNPELAARPDIAAQVALLYWKKRVRPKVRDWSNVAEVTRPINSRLAHLEDRKRDFAAYVDFYKLGDQI